MLKVRFRMHEARKVVKVSEPLTADCAVEHSDPYSVYGTEISRIIPGSREFWMSFGLDLVAFVDQRSLPDFFFPDSHSLLWVAPSSGHLKRWVENMC